MTDCSPAELVLLCQLGPESEKGKRVRTVLTGLGMAVKSIDQDQLLQTLGYCADLPGFEAKPDRYAGPELADEVLIMRDLSDDRLHLLLTALKEAGVGPIALKAVVTEHNQTWTLLDLISELRHEHEIMGAYTALRQVIRYADTLSDEGDEPFGPDFTSLLVEARQMLKGQDLPDAATLRDMTVRLKKPLRLA